MSLLCTSLLVFTSACPLTWQRQCIQLELRMTTAGPRSYTHTTSPSLQHKKAKSCLPWPAAETQTNYIGMSSPYYITQLMLPPCGKHGVLYHSTAGNRYPILCGNFVCLCRYYRYAEHLSVEALQVMADNVALIERVIMCVFVLQTAGARSGREGDSIPGPVHSHPDGGQEPAGTSHRLELCQKELGHSGSKVSTT